MNHNLRHIFLGVLLAAIVLLLIWILSLFGVITVNAESTFAPLVL